MICPEKCAVVDSLSSAFCICPVGAVDLEMPADVALYSFSLNGLSAGGVKPTAMLDCNVSLSCSTRSYS